MTFAKTTETYWWVAIYNKTHFTEVHSFGLLYITIVILYRRFGPIFNGKEVDRLSQNVGTQLPPHDVLRPRRAQTSYDD